MPGLITAATVVATGATMVGLDAAEYVAFSLIGKKLKLTKGANKNMITVNDFLAQAKAKKMAAEKVTMKAVDKVKEAATTAKDAVIGVLPATQAQLHALDAKLKKVEEVHTVLIASLEDRLEQVIEQTGVEVVVDPEYLTVRVAEILKATAIVKEKKEKAPEPAPEKVKLVNTAPSASLAVQPARGNNAGKARLGGRFEPAVDWSNVADNEAQ